MGIQGIGEYGSLYTSYKENQVVRPSEKVNSEQTNIDQTNSVENSPQIQKQEIVLPRTQKEIGNELERKTGVNDASLKFNAGDNYSYIGKDKDIDNLDMQKAISDMQKDSVLQKYQYFVGSSQNYLESKVFEDGVVIPKFDI